MSEDSSTNPSQNESSNQFAWVDALSLEEKKQLRAQAWERLLRAKKVNVNGKTVSLKALQDLVEKERRAYDHGLLNSENRTEPRSITEEKVPSRELRRGSYKQMLREHEEDALELTRVATGVYYEPKKMFGITLPQKEKQFAYGIFARTDRIEKHFKDQWAGQDPIKAINDPALYHDILQKCNLIELTLMIYTSKALPISRIQPVMKSAMKRSMERLGGESPLQKEDHADLEKFIHLLDEQRLATGSFMDKGCVKPGTHIIVAVTPDGGLAAEAITPGNLAQRKTCFIGRSHNHLVTAALFDNFVGADPFIGDTNRRNIGRGFVWAANGLSFKPTQGKSKKEVRYVDENGKLTVDNNAVFEEIVPSTSVFRLIGDIEEPVPMLLRRISRRSIAGSMA